MSVGVSTRYPSFLASRPLPPASGALITARAPHLPGSHGSTIPDRRNVGKMSENQKGLRDAPRKPLICWSGRPDSNRRRPAWEAGILPLNYGRPALPILLLLLITT